MVELGSLLLLGHTLQRCIPCTGTSLGGFATARSSDVVNDPRVLSDLRRAVESQNVVDRMKDELNAEKRQLSMVSLFAALQLKMADAIPTVPEDHQRIIDKAQARVLEQQHVVDDLQRKVDAEANASYAESRARITIFSDRPLERV